MKKGIGKIILGVAIFVASIILPAIIIVSMVMARVETTKFKAPGSMQVNIEASGKYSLSNNFTTIYQGKSYSYSAELPDGMNFSLTNNNTGKSVPMQTGFSSTTTSGNEKSKSIGYFEVTTPGQYTVSVTGNKQPRIFSFGKNQPLVVYGFILIGAFLLVPISFVVGIILVIFGILNLVKGNNPQTRTAPPAQSHPATESDYTANNYRD